MFSLFELLLFSDIPSSFELQSQYINVDAKENEAMTHDQLPKDVANQTMMKPDEQVMAPSIPQGTATSTFNNVPQEAIMQMQQQQQPTMVDSTAATPVVVPAATTQIPASVPTAAVAPVQTEPSKDLESASPTKSAPVRKISRFLVSPAILTVTNEKSAQNICVEDPIKSPLPTVVSNSATMAAQSPNFIQNMANIPSDQQFDPQNQVKFAVRVNGISTLLSVRVF